MRDVQVQFAPLVAHTHVQVQRSSNDRDSSHKCCLRLEAVAKDFPVERQCAALVRKEGVPTYVFHQTSTEEPVEEVDVVEVAVLDALVPGGE